MKHILFFAILIIVLLPKTLCQTRNENMTRNDTVRTEFTDYVLLVKVIDSINQCHCNDLQIQTPTTVINYGSQARFIRIKVLDICKVFSSDTIDPALIKNIELLLVPASLSFPQDTVIPVLLHRAHTYDYLEFDNIVDTNSFFYHASYYAGNRGLYESVKRPSLLGRTLMKLHLANLNTVSKGKSKDEKNILRCIRTIKKQKMQLGFICSVIW